MRDAERGPGLGNDPLGLYRHEDAEFGVDDVVDVPTATHWPSVPAAEAAGRWSELGEWVEHLQERFAHLDHHVIPWCWWQHNEHVEALCALRDFELCSFSADSPATAPIDWMRALRDVVQLLRAWTAEVGCGGTHRPASLPTPATRDGCEWEQFVASDTERRAQRDARSRATPDPLERDGSAPVGRTIAQPGTEEVGCD